MKLSSSWKDMIDVDFPARHPITKQTRREVKRLARKYRCSMRVATGRVRTDEDHETWRRRVLNTPLP